MKTDYDIAVAGSGFGGSLLAMIARRLGLSVLLLEKGRHPRFAIGESTSPLANLLVEQLARRYDLPRLLPLTSYGPWQRAYPHVGCGLKRGFTYFHQESGQDYRAAPDRANQLMVAASPHDEVADTHWLRAEVDQFLVQEAVAIGADFRDQVTLTALERQREGIIALAGEQQGQPFAVKARLVVDATGPRGLISQRLGLPEASFADYPLTQSLYSHFTGVRRCDGMPQYSDSGAPPYPCDDAALHHVFDGGWMWVLRFNNGVASAGITVTDAFAGEIGLADGADAWQRFLSLYPAIGGQFASAEAVRPFVHAPRLSYRTRVAAGPGWVMLPSAAAFVDPLFSTGIPLTLLGIERLGRIIEEAWGSSHLDARLAEYGAQTLREADTTADFIGACYASMGNFPIFAALSMFYFTAASYGEMARRLERPQLAGGFLAAKHPVFGPGLRRCAAWAREHTARADRDAVPAFQAEVTNATACLNVAGLCDPFKENWYGVDLNDVVTNAGKLDMTPAEMQSVLQAAPWAQFSQASGNPGR